MSTTPTHAPRPALSTAEALEARRDDLFDQLCREGGSVGEWAELNRMTAALQAELLGEHDWPPFTFDAQAAEAWYESMTDVPYD